MSEGQQPKRTYFIPMVATVVATGIDEAKTVRDQLHEAAEFLEGSCDSPVTSIDVDHTKLIRHEGATTFQVIGIDNYAREYVNDQVIAQNVPNQKLAEIIAEAVNAYLTDNGRHESDRFAVVKPSSYVPFEWEP